MAKLRCFSCSTVQPTVTSAQLHGSADASIRKSPPTYCARRGGSGDRQRESGCAVLVGARTTPSGANEGMPCGHRRGGGRLDDELEEGGGGEHHEDADEAAQREVQRQVHLRASCGRGANLQRTRRPLQANSFSEGNIRASERSQQLARCAEPGSCWDSDWDKSAPSVDFGLGGGSRPMLSWEEDRGGMLHECAHRSIPRLEELARDNAKQNRGEEGDGAGRGEARSEDLQQGCEIPKGGE